MSSGSSNDYADVSSSCSSDSQTSYKPQRKRRRMIIKHPVLDEETPGPSGIQVEMDYQSNMEQLMNISLTGTEEPVTVSKGDTSLSMSAVSVNSNVELANLPSTSAACRSPPVSSTKVNVSPKTRSRKSLSVRPSTPRPKKVPKTKCVTPHSKLRSEMKRNRKTKRDFQLKLLRSFRTNKVPVKKMHASYGHSDTDTDS